MLFSGFYKMEISSIHYEWMFHYIGPHILFLGGMFHFKVGFFYS